MKNSTIRAALLGALLLTAGTSEAFAWYKSFNGTQDQVRAACTGPGMVLNEASPGVTSCRNENKGTSVACNDQGHCNGSGSGPMPRLLDAGLRGVVTGVLAARTAPEPLDPWIIYGDRHSGESAVAVAPPAPEIED